ncbi:hypothetical protein B4102_2176 [Heyndrickxia sporothermodurans]|uniref:Uncharacterized protein n=1 Tax=Heyndrickxia sporothermodurans TaxID=46224 RepID=A0A150LGI4_9BACI|nr:hypothetical protein [Heyndrickxia sporothermodurans]KYD11448.1 hypothetical protein B4102_2176 [Heyndrickxia sporothermodurans]
MTEKLSITEPIKKEKALEKLQIEMNQNKDNAYVQAIGQYLMQQIVKYTIAAEAILATDKTLKKSLDFMKSELVVMQINTQMGKQSY